MSSAARLDSTRLDFNVIFPEVKKKEMEIVQYSTCVICSFSKALNTLHSPAPFICNPLSANGILEAGLIEWNVVYRVPPHNSLHGESVAKIFCFK